MYTGKTTAIRPIAVREICVSGHNGGPIKNLPCTPQYYSVVMYQRFQERPQLVPIMQRHARLSAILVGFAAWLGQCHLLGFYLSSPLSGQRSFQLCFMCIVLCAFTFVCMGIICVVHFMYIYLYVYIHL